MTAQVFRFRLIEIIWFGCLLNYGVRIGKAKKKKIRRKGICIWSISWGCRRKKKLHTKPVNLVCTDLMPPKHSFWQRKSIRFCGWTNGNHKKIFWLSALTFIIDLYVPWIMRKCGKIGQSSPNKTYYKFKNIYTNMNFIQIHKWPCAFLSDTHNLTFASNSYFQQHFNDQRLESQILLAWNFFRLGKACNLERDLWL